MFLNGTLNLESESNDVKNLIRFHAASIIVTVKHYGNGIIPHISGERHFTKTVPQRTGVDLEVVISTTDKRVWNDSSYIVNLIVKDEAEANEIARMSNSIARKRESSYSVPIFHEYFEPILAIFDK